MVTQSVPGYVCGDDESFTLFFVGELGVDFDEAGDFLETPGCSAVVCECLILSYVNHHLCAYQAECRLYEMGSFSLTVESRYKKPYAGPTRI